MWKGREVLEQIHTSNFTEVCNYEKVSFTYMVLTELKFLKLWYQGTVTVLFSNKKYTFVALYTDLWQNKKKSKDIELQPLFKMC